MNIHFPTCLIRKAFLKSENLRFREEVGLGADLFLWFEINCTPYKMYFIHKPLLKYRVHSSQGSCESHFNLFILFFSKASQFLLSNDLQEVIPLMRNKSCNWCLSKLTHDFANGYIDKELYDSRIKQMKQIGLWSNEIDLKVKIKLFLNKVSPRLTKKVLQINKKVKGVANK